MTDTTRDAIGRFGLRTGLRLMASACVIAAASAAFAQQEKPNIVLINMDNFGYGELGVYGGGIVRGGATPRIDELASEGMRLLNFNVEAQCTPSRAALLTGRYAKRTGNGSVPLQTVNYGLTQWEYTMAEMLSDAGYATAHFGKWNLGQAEGRYPTNQGFDEWYGIPNSTDESRWPTNEMFLKWAKIAEETGKTPMIKETHVLSGIKGSPTEEVKVFELVGKARDRPRSHRPWQRVHDTPGRSRQTVLPVSALHPDACAGDTEC